MIDYIINIITICGILLLGGCSIRQESNSYLHAIDFGKAIENVEDVMLSKYVSSIEYTPLETNPKALLGNIRHWFTTDENKMFFVSAEKMRCIHIFNRDGKYIGDIGQKGRGPGEYLAVRTMTIVPEINALMIEAGTYILFYSLDDGSCINKFDFADFFDRTNDITNNLKGHSHTMPNMSAGRIILHNGYLYVTMANNTTFDQVLLIMDIDFNPISSIELGKTSFQYGLPRVECSIPYIYNNDVKLINSLYDTIYSVNKNKIKPYVTFNYGEYSSLSKEPIRTDVNTFFRQMSYRANLAKVKPTDINETLHMFYGTIFISNSISTPKQLRNYSQFIYDKQSKKSLIIKHSNNELDFAGFTNDIDGGMPFWPSKQIGNKLYQFVDAVTFIEMSQKYNSPRMKEIASTLTDESNPVLIEATLKNSLD